MCVLLLPSVLRPSSVRHPPSVRQPGTSSLSHSPRGDLLGTGLLRLGHLADLAAPEEEWSKAGEDGGPIPMLTQDVSWVGVSRDVREAA